MNCQMYITRIAIVFNYFDVITTSNPIDLTILRTLNYHCITKTGNVKGWAFGKDQQIACANVEGKFYAIQGKCPRCAFDLFKGDVVTDAEAFGKDVPRLACPTCATTYSLRTGAHGPALKRTGLAGFVGGLTKTATINDSSENAKW